MKGRIITLVKNIMLPAKKGKYHLSMICGFKKTLVIGNAEVPLHPPDRLLHDFFFLARHRSEQ
jgi:hypothetical protein